MVKVNKLRAKIVENELSVREIAERLGVSYSALYNRIRKGTLTIRDIGLLRQMLHLSQDEVDDIFFANIVA